MKKSTFVSLLDAVKSQDGTDDGFSKALGLYLNPDFYPPCYTTELISAVLTALKNEMDDKYDNITYYAWETDWGRKSDELFITAKDGTEYKFKTAGDLYDYLMLEKEWEKSA